MLIDDLTKLPDSFKEGYRVVLLLHRNKDGAVGNAHRKCFKIITNGVQEWTQAIEKLKHMKDTAYPLHRIYSTVNSRNMCKAIHEFKKRQLEFDYANNPTYDFYLDIENRFVSCLMNPSCRNESFFLVDCDCADDYTRALNEIHKSLIVFDYETKNGRHLVTKPFNPNGLQLDIKKDDLLSIG